MFGIHNVAAILGGYSLAPKGYFLFLTFTWYLFYIITAILAVLTADSLLLWQCTNMFHKQTHTHHATDIPISNPSALVKLVEEDHDSQSLSSQASTLHTGIQIATCSAREGTKCNIYYFLSAWHLNLPRKGKLKLPTVEKLGVK